ncbi:putative disease resistance protein RGA3 [Hevea brasiliensis]|uniref:putative disease resistance protein RGA3 n=1 Tax=Hevea brasiliensis TaxID=3981 RepID=UPI0025EFD968|nr:putative disease resistance protein RGA3 [Hevea brasiliensis]
MDLFPRAGAEDKAQWILDWDFGVRICRSAKLLLHSDPSAAYVRDQDENITLLHNATLGGVTRERIAKTILSHCPDCCELVDRRGRNALRYAVESKSITGLRAFLRNPFISNLINQKDDEGNTPLHLLTTVGFGPGLFLVQPLVDKMAVNSQEMPDLVLSPLLEVIFDRVASPVLQRLGDSWDLKDNLKKLQHVLLMVQAILEDAEQQQLTRKGVKIGLSRLQDAAYDAEDLLDDFAAKAVVIDSGKSSISISINAGKVRKTLQDLELTAIEGLSLNLKEGSIMNRSYNERETSSFIVESQICGREKDRENIVKLLLSCEATQEGNVIAIPIIGIGGTGKTTLAQLAYNDERMTQHFDVKIWVFVSENFNSKRIMKEVLESSMNGTDEWDKKRLIFSGGVGWKQNNTEDQDEWDKQRLIFSGGVAGSKIIITSHNKKFGMATSISKRRRREVSKSFAHWNANCPKMWRSAISSKKPGKPNALQKSEREWLLVKSSDLWNLITSHGGILPSLMLSYHHLPSHLKRCFVFCSIFLKNYEIIKEKLIHLWMAEGLIQLEGDTTLEDIGNENFNDLLWMCFFQEAEKCNTGNMTRYKMRDIIHDLARYVAGKEFVILDHSHPGSSMLQTHHSSILCKFGSFEVPEGLYEAEHLRTILLIVGGDLQEVPIRLLSGFKYLWVLDMKSCGLTKLHELIGGLTCLRYLDLSYTLIRTLPPIIRNLCLLQTLNLHGCSELEQLPNLASMADLRHLIISECGKLIYVPFSIRTLHRVQSLPMFIVQWGSFNALGDLEHLNLYSELKIKHLQNVKGAYQAQLANMRMKRNLEILGLYWERYDRLPLQGQEHDDALAEGILEALLL